jgi:hypothetical protein
MDDGGFWRRGAVKARLRVRVVLRAQGGGTVWRHGGVDGKPGERLRWSNTLEVGSRRERWR